MKIIFFKPKEIKKLRYSRGVIILAYAKVFFDDKSTLAGFQIKSNCDGVYVDLPPHAYCSSIEIEKTLKKEILKSWKLF